MKQINFLILLMIICSCAPKDKNRIIENYMGEIVKAEQDFEKLVADSGLSAGFGAYAAEDAKINRGDLLIRGKESIRDFYKNRPYKNVVLKWSPDYVDVSSSGDLGYTYGNYTFSATDSLGNEINASGIFHTVWKRQKDGSWKFVWD